MQFLLVSMFSISLSVLLSSVTATSMVIDTINGQFPVDFLSTNGVTVIPGFARLSFVTHLNPWHNVHRIVHEAHGVVFRSADRQDSFRIGLNSDLGVIRRNENSEPILHVAVRPRSAFARAVGDFAIEPLSNSTGRIHINPVSVNDLVYDGQIFYSPTFQDPAWLRLSGGEYLWGVNAAIQIVHNHAVPVAEISSLPLQFQSCIIGDPASSTTKILTLPNSTFQGIEEIVAANGLAIVRRDVGNEQHRYIRGEVTQQVIESFPTLQYILESTDGSNFSIATISPNEYIVQTGDTREFELLVRRGESLDFCVITDLVLSKLVIHFDTRNNRIGFGEPWIEIN